MSRVLGSFHIQGNALDYRVRLCLFVSLFALSLTSASLQIAYGLPFVRNLFTGDGEYSDIDICELQLAGNQYVGMKFKTRGVVWYVDGRLYLHSFLAHETGLLIEDHWSGPMPAEGSFIEVKGIVREKFYAYAIRYIAYSWEHSSIGYEVLIDFLTASTVACTFILLLWSMRAIGASIASRAYLKRRHILEAI